MLAESSLDMERGLSLRNPSEDPTTENAGVSRLIGGLKPHGSVAQRKRYGFKGSDVSAMRSRLSVGTNCKDQKTGDFGAAFLGCAMRTGVRRMS